MKKALLIVSAFMASFAVSAQDASATADSLFNMLDEITVVSDVIDIAVGARDACCSFNNLSFGYLTESG